MAGARVLYQFDDRELREMIQQTGDRIKNVLPAMKAFGEYMVMATQDRFAAEKAPDGSGWKALSPRTENWKEEHGKIDKILQQDGYLRLIHYTPDNAGLTLSSNRKYAAIHQYGGMAGRGRKVEIPKREFLGFSDADKAEFMETVKDYLMLGRA
mgnify:CR=1 FL=1